MSEVQNVGAVDYAQYQPSQSVQETMPEEYNYQPEVYNEDYAKMQAANKSRVGATVLAAAIAAGIGVCGYFIGKRSGNGAEVADKSIDSLKKELSDLKNSEAIKNYDKLMQSAEEVEKFVEEKHWYNFFGVKNKIKEAFSFLKDDSAKVVEESKEKAEEAAKKAADEAKKTTEDAAKKASDEAKEGAEKSA